MNWEEIKSLEDYQKVIAQSLEQPQVIFKHSTRCFISKMVKRKFEADWKLNSKPYLLDLIRHRDVSNYIAQNLEVAHASPQVIVVKNKKAVYDNSHDGIDASQVAQRVA